MQPVARATRRLAVRLSIGQVYAFSVFKNPLIDRFGSSHTSIAVIFSIAIVRARPLCCRSAATWMERNGPRKAMVLSHGAAGPAASSSPPSVRRIGQLWIVYLGYGFLGGIGLGIGYISPVSTLIKWFPDRPGLATGLAIMGFGGGAMVASPLTAKLLDTYADDPADAIVPTMLTLAAIYAVLMTCGAIVIRVPAPGWRARGLDPARPTGSLQSHADVRVSNAVRTPQFYLLWIVLFTNVTAGIGILEQASPMIQDFFPAVTAATAAGFVGLLSLANMGGRFVWSTTSDMLGRKRTYVMYLGIGARAVRRPGDVRSTGGRAVRRADVLHRQLLRRRLRHRSPPYLKDLFGDARGRRHPRSPADGLVAAGVGGAADRRRRRRRRVPQGVEGAARTCRPWRS